MMNSTDRLVEALISASAPDRLITMAKSGVFNDIVATVAFPIVALVRECELVGLKDIADRARKGEFDATSEEWDEWIQNSRTR